MCGPGEKEESRLCNMRAVVFRLFFNTRKEARTCNSGCNWLIGSGRLCLLLFFFMRAHITSIISGEALLYKERKGAQYSHIDFF